MLSTRESAVSWKQRRRALIDALLNTHTASDRLPIHQHQRDDDAWRFKEPEVLIRIADQNIYCWKFKVNIDPSADRLGQFNTDSVVIAHPPHSVVFDLHRGHWFESVSRSVLWQNPGVKGISHRCWMDQHWNASRGPCRTDNAGADNGAMAEATIPATRIDWRRMRQILHPRWREWLREQADRSGGYTVVFLVVDCDAHFFCVLGAAGDLWSALPWPAATVDRRSFITVHRTPVFAYDIYGLQFIHFELVQQLYFPQTLKSLAADTIDRALVARRISRDLTKMRDDDCGCHNARLCVFYDDIANDAEYRRLRVALWVKNLPLPAVLQQFVWESMASNIGLSVKKKNEWTEWLAEVDQHRQLIPFLNTAKYRRNMVREAAKDLYTFRLFSEARDSALKRARTKVDFNPTTMTRNVTLLLARDPVVITRSYPLQEFIYSSKRYRRFNPGDYCSISMSVLRLFDAATVIRAWQKYCSTVRSTWRRCAANWANIGLPTSARTQVEINAEYENMSRMLFGQSYVNFMYSLNTYKAMRGVFPFLPAESWDDHKHQYNTLCQYNSCTTALNRACASQMHGIAWTFKVKTRQRDAPKYAYPKLQLLPQMQNLPPAPIPHFQVFADRSASLHGIGRLMVAPLTFRRDQNACAATTVQVYLVYRVHGGGARTVLYTANDARDSLVGLYLDEELLVTDTVAAVIGGNKVPNSYGDPDNISLTSWTTYWNMSSATAAISLASVTAAAAWVDDYYDDYYYYDDVDYLKRLVCKSDNDQPRNRNPNDSDSGDEMWEMVGNESFIVNYWNTDRAYMCAGITKAIDDWIEVHKKFSKATLLSDFYVFVCACVDGPPSLKICRIAARNLYTVAQWESDSLFWRVCYGGAGCNEYGLWCFYPVSVVDSNIPDWGVSSRFKTMKDFLADVNKPR